MKFFQKSFTKAIKFFFGKKYTYVYSRVNIIQHNTLLHFKLKLAVYTIVNPLQNGYLVSD